MSKHARKLAQRRAALHALGAEPTPAGAVALGLPRRLSIVRCVPTLGMVSAWWSRCCESMLWPNCAGKTLFYLRDDEGNSIAETRNALVQQTIDYADTVQPVSHIHWVDDDVLLFPACLVQLLSHDRDIAAGVYFTKVPGRGSSPLVYPTPQSGAAPFIPNQQGEVWGHGMGNCLVRLDVYRRMLAEQLTRTVPGGKEVLRDKYGRPAWYRTVGPEEARQDEATGVVHTGYTEDLWFLDRAAQLGYRPLVDTSKHAFGWHFDADKQKGYPEEQWDQWLGGKAITWQTPAGPVVWD